MKFPDFQILVLNLSISTPVKLKLDQAGPRTRGQVRAAGAGGPEGTGVRPAAQGDARPRGPSLVSLFRLLNRAQALWGGLRWLPGGGASLSPQALSRMLRVMGAEPMPLSSGPCAWQLSSGPEPVGPRTLPGGCGAIPERRISA